MPTTDPTEHDIAANLVLKALDGPRGPQVASAIIHTWLMGGVQGVPEKQTAEIVARWPYAAQVQGLLGQVEHLSLLIHMEYRARSMNLSTNPRAMVAAAGKIAAVRRKITEYLSRTIKSENARKALGLEPRE